MFNRTDLLQWGKRNWQLVMAVVFITIVYVSVAALRPGYLAKKEAERIERVKTADGVVEGEGYAIFPTAFMSSEEIRTMVDNYLGANEARAISVVPVLSEGRGRPPVIMQVWVTFEPL